MFARRSSGVGGMLALAVVGEVAELELVVTGVRKVEGR
jgi:hypothetical protein